jgi:hypothetical protein
MMTSDVEFVWSSGGSITFPMVQKDVNFTPFAIWLCVAVWCR